MRYAVAVIIGVFVLGLALLELSWSKLRRVQSPERYAAQEQPGRVGLRAPRSA